MDALTAEMSFESGDGERLYLITRGNELAKYFQPKGYPIAWNDYGTQNMIVPSSKVAGSPWAKKEVRQVWIMQSIEKRSAKQSVMATGLRNIQCMSILNRQTSRLAS